MYFKKKIVVVMPAYNAAQTVTKTVDEVREQGIVDEIILVDDRSRDDTVAVASSLLGVRVHVTKKTSVTAATRRRATGWRSTRARTLSSCCIRIINTRPG